MQLHHLRDSPVLWHKQETQNLAPCIIFTVCLMHEHHVPCPNLPTVALNLKGMQNEPNARVDYHCAYCRAASSHYSMFCCVLSAALRL